MNGEDRFSQLSAWLKSLRLRYGWVFSVYILSCIWLHGPAIRYRLPTDAVMIIFAAVGIVDLYDWLMVKIGHKIKDCRKK